MQIITLSDFKSTDADPDFSKGPLVLTQQGEPVYVVQSYADFQRQQTIIKELLNAIKTAPVSNEVKEAQALVTLLNIGSEEYRNGKHSSGEEVLERLREKFKVPGEKDTGQ